ncbi:MAG TPA: glycoside hydrolase family 99-like domain-containing protein [Tepidisphaeraceae bacterium]|jgi:hypothetical protein|nr:glycoside hydrolase family 99-like domain-containing protein [Tepidisphaeraceae bacterium]
MNRRNFLRSTATLAAAASNTPLLEAGYSSTTSYHAFATDDNPPGRQFSYAQGAQTSISRWNQHAQAQPKLPHFPEVPVGWDNSPRYGNRAHICVNRTADQFERLLVAAKHFIANQKSTPPAIYMGAWNEWTEDHYLLPDELYGYSYLEAIRRQFA